MRLKKRHIIAANVLRPFVRAFCRIRYNARSIPFQPLPGSKPPYFIIANHNSDQDPAFVSLCFPFPVFYVASDHIFRWGLLSRVIRYLFSPIPKLKSSLDLKTIRDIHTSLQSGASVCVFPEGNRSWAGRTGEISPAVGKLISRLPYPLVICRIRGAYLGMPRWGDTARRGKIECRPVRELPPEALKSMSVGEINEMIRKELYVDAAEDQKREPVRFRGKKLAQSIETVLYACPACGGFATICSFGDRAQCVCGLAFSYDSLGALRGAPFPTIPEWDRWQYDVLRERIRRAAADKTAIFSDAGQLLYTFERARKTRLLDQGKLTLYADRMLFSGAGEPREFPIKDILYLNIWGRLALQFTLADGRHFEIKPDRPRSAYKYLQAFRLIKEAERENVT